jgi:hypothetical protein
VWPVKPGVAVDARRRRAGDGGEAGPDLLACLAADRSSHVAYAAIADPGGAGRAAPGDFGVAGGWKRSAVADNPAVPAKLAEALAGDDFVATRIHLARGPAVPIAVLVRLAVDPDIRVRDHLTRNPACPTEVLVTLIESDNVLTEYRACRHPNCPPELRGQLSEGAPGPYVFIGRAAMAPAGGLLGPDRCLRGAWWRSRAWRPGGSAVDAQGISRMCGDAEVVAGGGGFQGVRALGSAGR